MVESLILVIRVLTSMTDNEQDTEVNHLTDHSCCEALLCNMDCDCNEINIEKTDVWPIANIIGNCWCGHSSVYHAITEDQPRCIECQCLDYVLDTWATYA